MGKQYCIHKAVLFLSYSTTEHFLLTVHSVFCACSHRRSKRGDNRLVNTAFNILKNKKNKKYIKIY